MKKARVTTSPKPFLNLIAIGFAALLGLNFSNAANPTLSVESFISQVESLRILEHQRTQWIEPSTDFLKYEREYEESVKSIGLSATPISRSTLDSRLQTARTVMISDIHSSKLSQKRYLEALQTMKLAPSGDEIVLVLEFIPAAFQEAVQFYLEGKMGLKQLKNEIRFNPDGRDWESYSTLLREAKKGKHRVLASDLHISDQNPKFYTLADRDDLAAKLIAEDKRRNPQARYLIFYGAYHTLGIGHLSDKLKGLGIPVDLTVLNFADEIYLRELSKHDQLDAVDVMQFSENVFFWNSAPVMERLTAALISLDQREAVAKRRMRDLDFFDVNCRKFKKDLGSDYLHRSIFVPENRKDPKSRDLRIFFYHKPLKENLPIVLVAGSSIGNPSWDDFFQFQSDLNNVESNVIFVDFRGTGCSTPFPNSLDEEELLANHYGPSDIAEDLLSIRRSVDPKESLHWNLFAKDFGNRAAAKLLKVSEVKWDSVQFYGFSFQESPIEDLREKIKSQRKSVKRYFQTYTGDEKELDVIFGLFPSQACLQFVEVNICGSDMMGVLAPLFDLRSNWSVLHDMFQQLKSHDNSEFNRTQILPISRNFRRNQILKIAYQGEDFSPATCLDFVGSLYSKEDTKELRTLNDCGLRRAIQPTEESLKSKILSGQKQVQSDQSFRTSDYWKDLSSQSIKFWIHLEEIEDPVEGFRYIKGLQIPGAEFHILKEPNSLRFFDSKIWNFPAR